MVIRLILTYGSMVWWPRVWFNVNSMELNKLETSLPGYNWGNEDDLNSTSGDSPAISASACGT